jgi:hypothetical protein
MGDRISEICGTWFNQFNRLDQIIINKQVIVQNLIDNIYTYYI